MTDHISIRGELMADPKACTFHLDPPAAEEGWTLTFGSAEDSRGSPIVDALFAVPGVAQVRISGSQIAVWKDCPDPWPEYASLVVSAIRAGFTGDGPPVSEEALDEVRNAPPEDIGPTVERLFEDHINPALASHGGFARLVRVDERDVFLEMGGGCQGCAASQATLRHGIESAIRQVAPQVRNVVDVTDHAAGDNPYYSS